MYRLLCYIDCVCVCVPLGRAYSKTLQQAAITVLSKRYCERHYGNQLTSRMLCAGSAVSGRHVDSCRGDSGGPLVCERGGRWIVYGVTSWGHACRLQDSPGVYSRVSSFMPWITKVTSQQEMKSTRIANKKKHIEAFLPV